MKKETTNSIDGSEEKYRTLFNSIDEGFCIVKVFYNDEGKIDVRYDAINPAFKNIIGVGDEIVGRTAREFFSNIDEAWLNTWERAAFGGKVIHYEDFFDYSNKWIESSWTPIGEKNSGEVAVLFKDVTERRNTEERQAYSLKLTHVLQSVSNAEDIQRAASELLGKHLKCDRVLYADVNVNDETYIIKDNYFRQGIEKVIGKFPLSSFGTITQKFKQGENLVLKDVSLDEGYGENERNNLKAINVIAALAMPVLKDNQLVAVLSAHHVTPRIWTTSDIAIMEETGQRTWTALQRAKAEDALLKSEERYRMLFNSMDEGYCIIEFIDGPHGPLSDYVHIEANPAYTINAGIPDIVGKRLREIVQEEADSWLEIYGKVLLTGKPIRFEQELIATGRHLELSAYRIEPAELKQVAVLFKDITERKKAEQKVRDSEKLLEQKVKDRTAELELANEELGNMNKELESFTYISSHDLQEPLRKIQIFAGRIIEKDKEHLSDTAKDYLSRMSNAATRMQFLIQDLLAFSRIKTAERKFESANLKKIIEEVVAEFKEIIEEKKARVEIFEMGEIKIIPFQFQQLIQNLISNSLKFSKPGIPPHIVIKSELIPGGQSLNFAGNATCHIIYADNGIGFEPHYSEKIFEVFQRLHGKDQYEGTGIGLAIAKKIAELHNGKITATSELDKGARFDIYLPV